MSRLEQCMRAFRELTPAQQDAVLDLTTGEKLRLQRVILTERMYSAPTVDERDVLLAKRVKVDAALVARRIMGMEVGDAE